MKKKVVILFPYEWVSYSPTVLNLVEILKEFCDVDVFAFDNGKYNNKSLDSSIYHLIHIPLLIFWLLASIGIYKTFKALAFEYILRKKSADVIIGVDSLGMYIAQSIYGSANYLSLEINQDYYFKRLEIKNIESVAIQSEERLAYQFPRGFSGPIYILPNAPILESREEAVSLKSQKLSEVNTILLGNIIPSHGLFICIDSIAEMSKVTLTLKGTISNNIYQSLRTKYANLIDNRRLMIDKIYTPQSEIIKYLRSFDIGFCFYDFKLISKGNFNYISSPSGKMYNYFAAGIPVIGSDVTGLQPVKLFNAGILLPDPTPKSVQKALQAIQQNYPKFREGCFKAALSLDFRKYARDYRAFLLQ